MDDALVIRNLTVATVGMGEQLRTAISFSEPNMAKLWKEFMEMFSMLYGVTKRQLNNVAARKRLDEFMRAWFKYGFAVKHYHDLTEKVAQKLMSAEDAAPALEEARSLFMVVNPATSLEMLDLLADELHEKGLFSIKEAINIGEDGYGEISTDVDGSG